MKSLRTLLSVFLLCVLLVSSFLLPGFAREAPAFIELPPDEVLPDSLTVLSDHEGGFYLVSSNIERTSISYLEGKTGSISPFYTLDTPYSAAALQGDCLALACPLWREEGNNVVFFSRIYLIPLSGGEVREITLFDTYIQNQLDFALLPDGFAAVDSQDRSHIRRFDLAGNQIRTLEAEGELFQIAAGDEGALFAEGSQGEFYVVQGGALLPAPEAAVSQPFTYLGGSRLLGRQGDLWEMPSEGSSPAYCYQTFVQGNRAGLSSHGLVLFLSDRFLMLDTASGEAIGQISLEAHDDDLFFVSGGTALVIREEAGRRKALRIPLDDPDPVEIHTLAHTGGQMLEDELLSLWRQSLPQCADPEGLFTESPDLTHFSTPGRVSVENLADGLLAVNFYRSLYGLSSLSYQEDGCRTLQYGAVLSLYRQEDGSFQTPDAMGGDFYEIGRQALSQSFVFAADSGASSPIADAVHSLFRENQTFRQAVLTGEGSLSLACAPLEDGSVRVLLSIRETTDPAAPLTFPPPGYYPAVLAQTGEWSAILPESVRIGERGEPAAVITDLTDGSRTALSSGDGLTWEGKTLYLAPGQTIPGHRYRIRVEHLTEDGLPAALEWETVLSAQTLEPPVLLGDVNLDGELTSADEQLLLDDLLERTALSAQALAAADLTEDGVVNTIDLLALEKQLNSRS